MIRTRDCLNKQFHALANDTLKKLELSNLITVERLGRYKKYRLNKEAFEEISFWLSNLIST
jgi:hypothetical protein